MVAKNESTTHGPAHTSGDNEPELNIMLDDIRDAGMRVTNTWKNLWLTAIQYAWGQHFEGWELKEEWQYVVINRIYPLMFQTIAKLASNNPKILTHAWDDDAPGTTEYADQWAGHLDYLWKSPYELNMRKKLIMGLLDCAIFGYMVGEPHWKIKPRGGWDDREKEWVGKAGMRFHHPALFWTDPSAEDLEHAENCGVRRQVKMEWAVARWPEHKKAIEAEAYTSSDDKWFASNRYYAGGDISVEDQKGNSDTTSKKKRRAFSRIPDIIQGKTGISGNANMQSAGSDQKYVDLEKIYWRDYSERKVKLEDNVELQELVRTGKVVVEETTGLIMEPGTSNPIKEYPRKITDEYTEPLYPNGRFVLRIGRTILNPKKEDQVYDRSRWPFIVMPYHILPHMWQGANAVEMSRTNNDMLNMTISAMVNQVRRTADPTKVVEAGALATGRDGKLREQQKGAIRKLGRIIIAARGKVDKIRDWIYQPLDPAVANLASVLKQNIDDQMFMQDVARGAASPGQQTKAEIVRLDRNSDTYTALQAVFLDKFIDDTMTLIAEIIQQEYEPGRLMKVLQDDDKQSINATQELLDVRFDVNIEPGSTLPFDELKKQTEYKAAYDMLANPVPNPMIEDMLRILNISKRKEILAKYQGLQLFRQFMQMGALLAEAAADPEGGEQVQEIMGQMSNLPGMQELIKLLLQAGQLAPAAGVGAPANA